MKKKFAILGILLGTGLASAVFAAMPAGASISADGRMTFTAPGAQRSKASPGVRGDAIHLKEIYSTFSSDEANLYDCCIAYNLTTAKSLAQARQTLAIPFTTARPGLVSKVQLGLSYFAGTNAISISLRADDGGLPGKALHTFVVSDIPPGGSCCEVMVAGPKVMLVKGSTTYWIVAQAKGDTYGGWNLNTANMDGPFAINVGNGWQSTTGTLGALRVLGE